MIVSAVMSGTMTDSQTRNAFRLRDICASIQGVEGKHK